MKKQSLKFVPVDMNNIILATQTQMSFWPTECGFNSYYRAYKKGKPYYLVYDGDTLVGITGIYDDERLGEEHTAWLGWFGVLEVFRKRGLGKEILLQTLRLAKSMGYDTLRLNSSKREDVCPNALHFYTKMIDKLGGFLEDYTLEQQDQEMIVVSFPISTKKITKWGNRKLYLDDDLKDEQEGYKNFLKHIKHEGKKE